jgi:hypothetical protein
MGLAPALSVPAAEITSSKSIMTWVRSKKRNIRFIDAFIRDSTDIVGQAAQGFLNSLTPEESCTLNDPRSPRQVLKDVQGMCFKRNTKIQSSCWARIRRFSDHLEPYMKGFDLIVQSHPEIAAIVWGAFRLVITVRSPLEPFTHVLANFFELANSYVTFFQKLSEFMERLALEMPGFQRILQLPSMEFPSSLKQSMSELYVAVFDFFKASIKVFRKSNGGMCS